MVQFFMVHAEHQPSPPAQRFLLKNNRRIPILEHRPLPFNHLKL